MFALKAEHLELGKFIDGGLQLVRDSRLNRYTIGSNLATVLFTGPASQESLTYPPNVKLKFEEGGELPANHCVVINYQDLFQHC